MGLDDEQLVDPSSVPAALRCSICTDVFEDPVDTGGRPCSHVFCRPCLEPALRLRAACPLCRMPMTRQHLRTSQVVGSILDEVQVRCLSRCGWTGRRDAHSGHVAACPTRLLQESRQQLDVANRERDQAQEAAQALVKENQELKEAVKDLRLKLAGLEAENKTVSSRSSFSELEQVGQDPMRHANAIFQHYEVLIHQWEPQKRIHDSTGNPHDANGRKFLHDAALLGFELFLYRLHGEQDVWTYLVSKSIEAQKAIRAWRDEDEGHIMFFLSGTLRSQKGYVSMFLEKTSADGVNRCELIPLDSAKLATQYNTVLLQGQIVDEALQALKDDPGVLVKTVSMLAFVWARWNLENEDKFRQNEVLLIMSTLIYNTVNVLERAKRTAPERVSLVVFEMACEYFLLLLHAVEWPKGWKTPLIARLQVLFPQATVAVLNRPGASRTLDVTAAQTVELREAVLQHPLTQEQARLDLFEASRSEPGQALFERHRTLYSWVMHGDDLIAQDYVLNIVPSLPGVTNVGT